MAIFKEKIISHMNEEHSSTIVSTLHAHVGDDSSYLEKANVRRA